MKTKGLRREDRDSTIHMSKDFLGWAIYTRAVVPGTNVHGLEAGARDRGRCQGQRQVSGVRRQTDGNSPTVFFQAVHWSHIVGGYLHNTNE